MRTQGCAAAESTEGFLFQMLTEAWALALPADAADAPVVADPRPATRLAAVLPAPVLTGWAGHFFCLSNWGIK